jgi:hypothetical protein
MCIGEPRTVALFTGAIAGATVSPLVDDIDPATLGATITELTSRMLKIEPS